MRVRTAGLMLVAISSLAVAPAGRAASTVNITISNFRYCQKAQCDATDTAYLRNGATGGSIADNPLGAVVSVHPGDTVVWTYADSLCDSFNTPPVVCPGHEVRLEDGTAAGTSRGTAAARSGATTITFTVPADAQSGSVIRYFCNLNSHWVFGTTGELRVI